MRKVFQAAFCLLFSASAFLYGLYRMVFCYPVKKRPKARKIPESSLYREHRGRMLEVIEEMEKTAHEEVRIVSTDGILLYGKLYQGKKGAPVVLFFHGYHGQSAWDGYGFFQICKKNGYSLLMVDERAHGKSGGRAITFGIKERYDCKAWTTYVLERFGEKAEVFLAGVSMGAASVMMACELGLPDNVKGIIADCGYSEPSAIIKETIRKMRLPVEPFYRMIKLGARLFGRFDLEEAAALRAVRELNIPILFLQGERDSVVPVSMGEALYNACNAQKERVLIAGADHANSAMTDYGTYERAVVRFIRRNLGHFSNTL